jgi:hypothetical protein
LHFFSWCSDEEEQPFFDKEWDFGIMELVWYISNMSKGL